MSYIEQEKKHTYRGVTYETFLEQSESGLSYWKAWALGIGQLVSIGGYGTVKDFSRKAIVAEAKKKIEADPNMATKQQAYVEHPGNWSGGKKPKLNPTSLAQAVGAEHAFKHAQAQFRAAVSHTFSEPHVFGEAIRNAEIAMRAAKREISAAGMSKYAVPMRNMAATIKTLKQEQERSRANPRRNPWMPGAYSAGQRYLQEEAAKEYKAQLARHLKAGRSKNTMRYSVPEWQQEMVDALGEDDDARFKGLMMQHRTMAIPLKRNAAKKNPNKPAASSSYGPGIFANALVYITDAGGTFNVRGSVYQSRTSRAVGGGYVVPDSQRGGDWVFPMTGRDVEVYVGDNYDEPVLQYKGMQKLRGNPAEKPRPGGVTPRSERRQNSWFITYAPPATVAPSQSPMAQYSPLVNPRPPGARSSRVKHARSAKKNPSGKEHAEIAVELLPALVSAYNAFVSMSSKTGPRQIRALAEALGRVEEHNKYATWPADAAMGMGARRNVQNYIDSAKSALRSASQTWRSNPGAR